MHLEIYDSVTSTQEIALLHLHNGEKGPSWVMARRQTRGMGRMGRLWSDGAGNLMATRYQIMPIALENISQLSFVTGLAVYDALMQLDGIGEELAIKWPNDILHAGRKLCGILISSESQGNGGVGIAIGIGINILSAPDIAKYKTISLASLISKVPTAEALLELIDTALEHRLSLWLNDGFRTIAADWLLHAHGRRNSITIQYANGPIVGNVIGIDDNGILNFKDVDGRVYDISSLD